jgi:hypothetical protein
MLKLILGLGVLWVAYVPLWDTYIAVTPTHFGGALVFLASCAIGGVLIGKGIYEVIH